jgi:p-cumate 2,3-dioxygenase subunit beta
MSSVATTLDRGAAEDLLFREAELLDGWQLEEWLALLTDDVRYAVTTAAPPADPWSASDLACIALDDAPRVQARARQLMGRFVWAEWPRSRTTRLITNVRVRDAELENAWRVRASFAVHRFAHGEAMLYVGEYEHVLVRTSSGLRIRSRTTWLNADVLRPIGGLSIIL